jgi:hypothetical protein
MTTSCAPETPENSPVHRNRLLCQLTARGGEEPERGILLAILEASFRDRPSTYHPSGGDEYRCIQHEFFAERAPLDELVTLSKFLPDVRFALTCQSDGEPASSGGCEAEVCGGEIVQYRDAAGEEEVPYWATPLGNWWLRNVAEKLLDRRYGCERGAVESGISLDYRERMPANIALEAFEHLKSLMDPIDQQMLAASENSHIAQIRLCVLRCKAADASVGIRKFVDFAEEIGTASSILTPEEVEQLDTTSRLLRKIAGSVPAKSEMF